MLLFSIKIGALITIQLFLWHVFKQSTKEFWKKPDFFSISILIISIFSICTVTIFLYLSIFKGI